MKRFGFIFIFFFRPNFMHKNNRKIVKNRGNIYKTFKVFARKILFSRSKFIFCGGIIGENLKFPENLRSDTKLTLF